MGCGIKVHVKKEITFFLSILRANFIAHEQYRKKAKFSPAERRRARQQWIFGRDFKKSFKSNF